jgi:ribosomal protein L11 methyltransferase
MSWLLLRIPASAAEAERLADALLEQGALSSAIEDANAGTEREEAVFGEPGLANSPALWTDSLVTALFPAATEIATVVQEAARQAQLARLPSYGVEEVPDQDWVRTTQSQFEPIPISPRLWIVPSWHTPPDPGAINIQVDPGLAFGTGSHPTTRLCLRWLDEELEAGESVLDYGCGSGILAIAAKKLGAGEVMGVDIDPQAVAAARENAARNGVAIAFALPGQLPAAQYDVVLANILANPLKVLAPALAARVKAGGRIVLSGLLAEQVEALSRLYNQWFTLAPPVFDEGWARLVGVRRP